MTGRALLRLRDLLLVVGCSTASTIAAGLVVGKLRFATLLESALDGRTLLWAAAAAAVAIGCAVAYVLGKPPCDRGDTGV